MRACAALTNHTSTGDEDLACDWTIESAVATIGKLSVSFTPRSHAAKSSLAMPTLERTGRGTGTTIGVGELPRRMHPLEVTLLAFCALCCQSTVYRCRCTRCTSRNPGDAIPRDAPKIFTTHSNLALQIVEAV